MLKTIVVAVCLLVFTVACAEQTTQEPSLAAGNCTYAQEDACLRAAANDTWRTYRSCEPTPCRTDGPESDIRCIYIAYNQIKSWSCSSKTKTCGYECYN